MNRIIERAGCVPWQKTFVNLRSTRRTELQERFPSYVVDSWLGHSSEVAAKHYLQVTVDHWDAARTALTGSTESREMSPPPAGGLPGGVIPTLSECFTAESDGGNRANPTGKDSKTLGKTSKVAQPGLSQSPETLGKTALPAAGGNTGGNRADETTAELLAIWDRLDASQRAELLAAARAAVRSQKGPTS
ncbi:hypothetical protein [Roseimaritima sediminicola]|uniref:hypothetical protein n=1 Tax=Roseimaritima sediminicola TaxID=2662066 RepID=UPI00129855ED|nr:hypothetical protein [Roseimaritima sediminicola]